MKLTMLRYAACGALLASLAACGGGGSGSSSAAGGTPTAQYGNMPIIISDASTDDWSMIGVSVLSVALVPQGGGANVTVYTAPAGGAPLNLVELDNLGDLIGSPSVPAGTYTGAVVTVSGNPGDVQLTASAEPQTGFALSAGTAVSSSNIEIQHTSGSSGSSGSLTVPIDVTFASPLVVSSGGTTPLDVEFDLSHPAFIIGHQPPGAGTLEWAVNFRGPVRHHPIADVTRLVLRHMYGNVNSVATDGSSILITKDFATLPIVSPETAVAGTQQLTIDVDATNGTLFYDVDAKTSTTVTSFANITGLAGKYVRVAARYQENGTLVATRIWASSTFADVWLSPEGHVLHVNSNTDMVTVTNELGQPVKLLVNANTQFYFRQPWSAIADATPIGTGTSFLTNGDLVRGFKVHASVVDPLAAQWVAQSIDIETAAYSGVISNANSTSFTYTHDYLTAGDDYSYALNYISSTSANGTDSSGNAITGFKYWNFAFPTLLTDGSGAVTDFIAATNGTVSFGGNSKPIVAYGVTGAVWGDPASTGWSAPWTVLLPVPVLASVTTPIVVNGSAITFTASAPTGTQAVTVDVSNASGSATLVYQIDRTGNVLTVSPIDITTTAGMTTFTAAMTAGTPVALSGIPQADGTLKSYVILYYTGNMMPMLTSDTTG